MTHNWCAICEREIPGDRLVCDKCRPLVQKLDRKSQRTFKREEKRLQDIEELRTALAPFKKRHFLIKEKAFEQLSKYLKKEEPNDAT